MLIFANTFADIFSIPLLRYAFLVGIIASIAFGIIGSYVVVKRISYIAGAISHSILGGIGAALYCQEKFNWIYFKPLYGAIISAILAAIIIGLTTKKSQQRSDTVIGAIWAIGMALGVLFFFQLDSGDKTIHTYLFGSILLVNKADLIIVGVLDSIILAIVLLFYDKFLAICFDDEFSELRGVRVNVYYLTLLCLVALTIVLLVQIVGIIMLIALLTLPAAISCNFTKKLSIMMLISIILCMFFTSGGLFLSYPLKVPSGPIIILIAGIAYLMVLISKKIYYTLKK